MSALNIQNLPEGWNALKCFEMHTWFSNIVNLNDSPHLIKNHCIYPVA